MFNNLKEKIGGYINRLFSFMKEKISKQNQQLREVLEAPVAEGQNLSQEELKKAYHKKLKDVAKKANIQIEVVE